jgi:polyhydroxyalkanoate synthesis regulator phasin
MPKSAVLHAARGRQGRPRRAELPNMIEGQIAEICRDLAVQTKRMRQLQEQADELRAVIRQWGSGADANLAPD